MPDICIQYYDTPAGQILLGSFESQLCLFDWCCRENRTMIDTRLQQRLNAEYLCKDTLVLQQTRAQVDEYFNGKRQNFNVPLLMVGTDFQKQVWHGLNAVPYGTTCSYLELSKNIGNEKAVRAVASASGANAISIMIPCHRIIGSDGSLVGYAGGLLAKKKLLQLEQTLLV